MPFVQRLVKPEFVSRSYRKKAGLASISDDNSNSNAIINGKEFDAVTNITLSNALRQMASVVIIANDIFLDLNLELQKIGNRTKKIKERIYILEENVSKCNPKEVDVPESDFETFLQINHHFKTKPIIDKELFVKNTRPINVQNLYEAAGKSPVYEFVDSGREGGDREKENATRCFTADGTTFFSNCDSFEQKKIKIDSEIEIRLPASIGNLRKWTSAECIGEVTVTPDCINKVSSLLDSETPEISSAFPSTYTKFSDIQGLVECNDLPIDHRLPSPEEQCLMIAIKYPAEIISVDITGRRFERMCLARKSMCTLENAHTDRNSKDDNERKPRTKKSRSKRRNTIIGIDPKEISKAVQGKILPCKSSNDLSKIESISEKSKSSDLLRKETPSTNNESSKSPLSRLNSLKNWGRNRLKLYERSADDKKKHCNFQEADSEIDEHRIIRVIPNKNKNKFFEKGKSYFSTTNPEPNNSEKNLAQLNYFNSDSTSNSPESINNDLHNPSSSLPSVKLRESSSLRRQRRIDSKHKDDPLHSSSGNWSASSESGRASIGSEITILPKSSASSMSLNHNTNSNHSFGTGPPSSIISRRRFLNTSASSSVTSEGPATPDPQIMNDISFIDDETSSSYSCDTEGYYTSFHIDSGLKTLREEEPVTPLHSTSALSSNNSIGTLLNQTGENEYELFGRGSTSTTASSAGTVCTTLILPNENDLNALQFPEINGENKLSYSSSNCSSSTALSTLERCATIKRNSKIFQQQKELIEVTVHLEKSDDINEFNDEYKNNTRNVRHENQQLQQQQEQSVAATKYELDCAEYSDVESVDRSERIRQKTAISSSRIPSMCIITPTTSDDENSKTDGCGDGTTTINRDFKYSEKSEKIDQNSVNIVKENIYTRNINLKQKLQIESYSIIESDLFTESYDNTLNGSFDKKKKTTNSTNLDIEIGFEKNIYHTTGEYVTLADISDNKKINENLKISSKYSNNNANTKTNSTPIYSNLLKNNPTEYISLKELPFHLSKNNHKIYPFGAVAVSTGDDECQQNLVKTNKGSKMPTPSIGKTSIAEVSTTFSINEKNNSNFSPIVERNSSDMRVTFNAQGKIIYNSDSLKRQKKRGHSTFLPGPHVKDVDSALLSSSSTPSIVVGVINNNIVNDDLEEDCYVKLSNEKIPTTTARSAGTTNKLLMSGGCANRALQKIRPVNSGKDKMQTRHKEEVNDIIDSANDEMQQHRAFQNLLHQTHEPFNRNAQIYGTLPRKDALNKKMMTPKSITSQKPSNMLLVSSTTMSPIVPCNKGSFRTSTPSKLAEISYSANEMIPPTTNIPEVKNFKAKNNIVTHFEEIPKVCSDRMGTTKTSLMDFKKLLLSKSTKNVISSHKVSAVEMLKVAKENSTKTKMVSGNTATPTNQNRPQTAFASPSMLLLDLSRSPRSFANRRMIRQGQFGSPSKYITGKKRNYGLVNTIGTDVMSTTIPEANKEDDSTSSSGSIGSQKSIGRNRIGLTLIDKSVSDDHIDLKNNFFLQAEENNFMKSEIDASKYRSHLVQYREELAKTMMDEVKIKDFIKKSTQTHIKQNISVATNAAKTIINNPPPSFETSL